MAKYAWDVFISHASEDKDDVARPLANHLAGFGLKVWLDESEIHLGDSLRERIDAGLAQSRFGIVILSPAFFSKIWTKSELDGLVAREDEGIKVILPIWHNLDRDEVRNESSILAGRLAAKTSEGLTKVAAKIVRSIENSGSISRYSTPLFEGRLTKKVLLGLPEGSFLLSNLMKEDLTPAFADSIPSRDLRETLWEQLGQEGISKAKWYAFEDASAYRKHMAARNVYIPEEAKKFQTRRLRKELDVPDFDIELVRAYVAAGKSPPEAWRPMIKSLNYDDQKYKFNNLDGISKLTQLERLDLFDVDPLNLDPLAGLKNLRWLYLTGDLAPDIRALFNLKALEHLDLNLSRISSIKPLSSLTRLKHLNIFCKNVKDASPLQNITSLEFLNLSMTPVRSIEPLRDLTRLRTLDLMATLVENIDALSGLHSLQNLSLWKAPVQDLSPLSGLKNLRTLDLDQTNIKDVSELQGLCNLRFLSVRNTAVQGLAKLKQIPNLEIFIHNESYNGKAKIDLSEDWQIWYWTRNFSVSEINLRSLIAQHGNSAATIRRVLDRR